jgi:hypothetical protein
MKVRIGKQKREIKDKSLFKGSYDPRTDDFQKRLTLLAKRSTELFNKRIKLTSTIDGLTVSITFEIKEEYGDYVMAIYDCETIKDNEKHHYIGNGRTVHECKGRKDQLATIMCKDGSPYYTVSVTYDREVQTICRTNQPIYLFQAFTAIATATGVMV